MANRESYFQAHPSSLVRGRILKRFKEAPPTWDERVELEQMRTDGRTDRYQHYLSRKISDKTIPTFTSQGDAMDFAEWESALINHFNTNNYFNSALRFFLAKQTLAGSAIKWWTAHCALRPRIVLSWKQLMELIRTEMVPEVAFGTLNDQWANLRYHGNLDLYFEKVRRLTACCPISPAEVQTRASRPFGQMMVEKVHSALAVRGINSLPPTDWERLVRTHVYEVENSLGFQGWAKGDLEPVFKHV